MTPALSEAIDLLRRCIGNAAGQDGLGLYDHGVMATTALPLSQAEVDAVTAAAEIDGDVRLYLARVDAEAVPRLRAVPR
jgi:hypothetical protein